jgi:protein-tyrosine phosphatase
VIDLHTHLIPGVDDGADTPEAAVAVLTKWGEQGVTAVCCTPHLRAGEVGHAPVHELDELLEELRVLAPAMPRLTRGFEIMLDKPEVDLRDRRLALNGSRYVLVEFGRLLPAEAGIESLKRLSAQGVVPVLAHPERYAVCSLPVAKAWIEAGAILQVDATTLLAESKRSERARELLAAGCATIIASDNHGDGRGLAVAVEWLESHGGGQQARFLAFENPAAILADAAVAPVPPLRVRRSWYSMLKSFVVGGAEA